MLSDIATIKEDILCRCKRVEYFNLKEIRVMIDKIIYWFRKPQAKKCKGFCPGCRYYDECRYRM